MDIMMATKRRKTNTTTSLLELVEAEAEEASLTGKNRVALMAIRPEIADVLARGYKWKVVYTALMKAGRIDMSYDTFRSHCRAMGLEIVPKSTMRLASTKSKKRTRRAG